MELTSHVYSDDDEDKDEDDGNDNDDDEDYEDDEDYDEDYNPEDSDDKEYEDYENDENDDDDSDSDSDPCACPHCLMDRIIGCKDCWDDGSVESDNDNESESENDSENENEKVHDSDNDDEILLDPDASPCAICMEPETAKRRFVHLPCCGTTTATTRRTVTAMTMAMTSMEMEMEQDPDSGKGRCPVDTSSTRFCQKCIARYLVTNGCAVPCSPGTSTNNGCNRASNDVSVTNNSNTTKNNVHTNNRAMAQLAGECPRCKKILVLKELNPDTIYASTTSTTTSSTTICSAAATAAEASSVPLRMSCPNNNTKHITKTPMYRHTVVATPSTEALFWYVAWYHKGSGRMAETNAEYRTVLLTVAACPNPNWIPEELLLNNSGSPETIRNLCQWGLLYRGNNTNTNTNTNTTRGRLQHQLKTFQRRILHVLPGRPLWSNSTGSSIRNRLWKGMAVVFGPRLESARSNMHNWKISHGVRLASEIFQRLPNREGIVYSIDPLVQSELRSLVARYLQCSVNGDGLHRDNDCDYEHGYYYNPQQPQPQHATNEDGALRLLPPLLRSPTATESSEMRTFCAQNGRRQSFMVAWNFFVSAWMALCRFRPLRGLQLMDHGMSLALFSTKHLGLPPVTDWPVPVVATSSEPTPKGRDSSSQTNTNSTNTNTNTNGWRWRWLVMSGLNIILVILAFKIVVRLVCIGIYLLLGASVCHVVGEFLEALGNCSIPSSGSQSQSPPGALKHPLSFGEEEETDGDGDANAVCLRDKRYVSWVVVLMYAAWHTCPALFHATMEVACTQEPL
jgi:hypothetical protein